jgi:hypothetical protein
MYNHASLNCLRSQIDMRGLLGCLALPSLTGNQAELRLAVGVKMLVSACLLLLDLALSCTKKVRYQKCCSFIPHSILKLLLLLVF